MAPEHSPPNDRHAALAVLVAAVAHEAQKQAIVHATHRIESSVGRVQAVVHQIRLLTARMEDGSIEDLLKTDQFCIIACVVLPDTLYLFTRTRKSPASMAASGATLCSWSGISTCVSFSTCHGCRSCRVSGRTGSGTPSGQRTSSTAFGSVPFEMRAACPVSRTACDLIASRCNWKWDARGVVVSSWMGAS